MAKPNRRFQPDTRSPLPRERRVCFAEPSVEEGTESTSLSFSEASAHPVSGHQGLSRGSIWGRSTSPYGASLPSTDSSKAALFGRPLPSRTSQFMEQPAHPPVPCWTAPSFGTWPEAFEPSSEAEFFQEVPADDRGAPALSWVHAVGVGLLAAAMLTVALALALTVDFPAPGFEPASTAMPHAMEIGARDVKIAVPLRPLNVPTRDEQTQTVGLTGTASRMKSRPRHGPATTNRGRGSPPEEHLRQPIGNRTRRSHDCGNHFYTYCAVGMESEAFYSSASNSCVRVAADSVHVCNHGANRFTSLGSCESSCVHGVGGKLHERCYESTLFTTCTRRDAVETWWFFDGSSCTQWKFPQGSCPAEGSRTFRSRVQCESACLHRERDEAAGGPCDVPVVAPCTPGQITHPYFADMRAVGNARCIRASSLTLGKRRCLVGLNKFHSVESCQRVCMAQ